MTLQNSQFLSNWHQITPQKTLWHSNVKTFSYDGTLFLLMCHLLSFCPKNFLKFFPQLPLGLTPFPTEWHQSTKKRVEMTQRYQTFIIWRHFVPLNEWSGVIWSKKIGFFYPNDCHTLNFYQKDTKLKHRAWNDTAMPHFCHSPVPDWNGWG